MAFSFTHSKTGPLRISGIGLMGHMSFLSPTDSIEILKEIPENNETGLNEA